MSTVSKISLAILVLVACIAVSQIGCDKIITGDQVVKDGKKGHTIIMGGNEEEKHETTYSTHYEHHKPHYKHEYKHDDYKHDDYKHEGYEEYKPKEHYGHHGYGYH